MTGVGQLGYFDPFCRRAGCTVAGTRPVPHPMAKAPDPPKNFEAALAELETILAAMEGGQLPLAETLAAHRRGAELLQYCQAALKDAQQQVQVLERGVLKAFAVERADAPASGQGDGP